MMNIESISGVKLSFPMPKGLESKILDRQSYSPIAQTQEPKLHYSTDTEGILWTYRTDIREGRRIFKPDMSHLHVRGRTN